MSQKPSDKQKYEEAEINFQIKFLHGNKNILGLINFFFFLTKYLRTSNHFQMKTQTLSGILPRIFFVLLYLLHSVLSV